MKAGLGVRLVAGAAFLAGALAATFLAGAAAFLAGAAAFLAGAAAFLAGAALVAGAAFFTGAAAFLAGVFFAVAMMKFLWSEVGSPLRNDVFTANGMLMEKEALSKHKNHFSLNVVADLPSLFGFCRSWQLPSSCFYAICCASKASMCGSNSHNGEPFGDFSLLLTGRGMMAQEVMY
jgi:hypothetical protein